MTRGGGSGHEESQDTKEESQKCERVDREGMDVCDDDTGGCNKCRCGQKMTKVGYASTKLMTTLS